MNSGLKECPFCFEIINARAVRCKHCHANLTAPTASVSAQDLESSASASAPDLLPSVCVGEHAPELITAEEVADILGHLVDRSLVVFDEVSNRFRLLETVRQYTRDRLRQSGKREEGMWCVRHCDHFLDLVEEAYEKRFTGEAPALMDTVELEHDNCRAALDFCAASSAVKVHLRLAGALSKFWEKRGYYSEGRERLAAALSRTDAKGASTARANALNGAAILASIQNEPQVARELYERSRELWSALDEKQPLAIVLNNLGLLEQQQSRHELSLAFYEQSLALMRELNDRPGMALVLGNIGILAKMQNDLARARPLLEESVALARETNNLYVLEFALSNLAQIATKQGDFMTARAQFWEGLGLSEASRNEVDLIEVLEAVAELAVCLQRAELAVRFIASAAAMRERGGIRVVPDDRHKYDRREQLLRDMLNAETFAEEWAAGFALSAKEAITHALEFTREDAA